MMVRKGMMVGKGKKGYHNIIPKDPRVHSQSAKGMKQPQRLKTGTFIKSKFTNAEGIVLSENPFNVKYNYKGKVKALQSNPKFWKKANLKDSDKDGVPDKVDCKPFDPKMQDIDLRKKYQPQWNFDSKQSAMKELEFQKFWNPKTYNWLKNKNVKISGKIISIKELLKDSN